MNEEKNISVNWDGVNQYNSFNKVDYDNSNIYTYFYRSND